MEALKSKRGKKLPKAVKKAIEDPLWQKVSELKDREPVFENAEERQRYVRAIERRNKKVIKDFENLLRRRRMKKGKRANFEDLEKVKQLLRRVLKKLEKF